MSRPGAPLTGCQAAITSLVAASSRRSAARVEEEVYLRFHTNPSVLRSSASTW